METRLVECMACGAVRTRAYASHSCDECGEGRWRDNNGLAQELVPHDAEQLLAVALRDCAQLQAELDAKTTPRPAAQYGQCETCGVFSDSAKALHDARRNCDPEA